MASAQQIASIGNADLSFKARLKQIVAESPYLVVANILVAGALTVTHATPNSFVENLIFSFCVGSIATVLLHLVIWQLLLRQVKLTVKIIAGISVVCCLLGLVLGVGLASVLIGLPLLAVLKTAAEMSNVYFVLMLMMCGATLVIFWIRGKMEKLRADIAQEKLRAEENARRSIQAQLQLLQAQIEPHMLFNTLANVQGLISFDPARASEMLDQLILYLRASLQAARAENTTLGAEFTLLQAYLELMAVRMGTRLSYELDLPPELAQQTIAPMLLQPLIENAIKHGVEPKVEGGKIIVTARRQGQSLQLCCADTGLGLDAPAQKGTRLGLANIRERLAALYGASATCTLRPNTPEGAIAEINIPFI
jgi:sensor histidine kinase YesM